MPPAVDVSTGSTDRRSSDEEGSGADITGNDGTPLMSAALSSVASLAWNAPSICRASGQPYRI
jgi:hypothetical protein